MINQIILAIDYGTKNVGLAISRGTLAEPLTIISNDHELITKIKEIVEAEGIELLLVGLPAGRLVSEIKKFAQELGRDLNLPIEFADEKYSSVEATLKLQSSGKMRPGELIDAKAAAVFLQEYIDYG